MTKPTIFIKNQRVDASILFGSFFGVISCIGNKPLLTAQGAFALVFVLSTLMYFAISLREYFGRVKGYKNTEWNIEMGIEDTIEELAKSGLKMKDKVGDYYVFTTGYLLLPNLEFLLQGDDKICKLIGERICKEFFTVNITNKLKAKRICDNTNTT